MNSLPEIQSALEGRYHVVREIGQGGMATVYLVRDLKHDRDVALKVLRAELAAIIGADRFLAEIKVTAHLQHPHILPLFDSGSVNGVVYYVMPFIDGESLRHRLDRDKQLPVADAVRIATEVAGALDYAHRHGVIHRDVKPENILLHDGRALVADFGIALAVSTAGKRMTETGMSVGTPQYMSPEQAMGALEITARSDVYSLGATTYEMLIGEPPFTGATAQAIVARVLTATPQSITAQRHTVSRDLEAAVLMALEKLPADRFATCTEFAEALSPRSAGVPTERITSASVWRGRVAKTPRQTRIARAAAGMAMLAAGALGGWLAARPSAPATLTFDQKTFKRLAVFNARFAPDGKTIVFSAATEGTIPNLYVIRPEYPEPQALGQQGTHLLSVSPQGELAVLIKPFNVYHRVFTGTLARMPLGGGAPRALKDSVREADWAPDGQSLAIVVVVNGKCRLEYPVGTVRYESNGYVSDPRVSPDGRRVAFVEHSAVGDDRGAIAVVDTADNRVKIVTDAFPSVQGTTWSTNGGEILFSAGGSLSHRAVHAVTLAGTVRVVVAGPGGLTVLDRFTDGTALVSRDDQPNRLMVHHQGASADSDASWLDASYDPVFSHDGTKLAFDDQSSTSGVNYTLMLRQTNGTVVRLGEGVPVAFSPDDQWLLVNLLFDGKYVLQPIGAGAELALDLHGLKDAGSGGWYPDGRAILMCGQLGDSLRRCYRAPIDGSPLTPVTPAIRGMGRLAPDGREVLVTGRRYTGPNDTGRVVLGLGGRLVWRWSADGRALFVRSGPSSVDRLDLATGRRELLFDVTPARGSAIVRTVRIAIADDPRVYAYVAQEYSSKLFVVRGLR